ncbi:N-acetylglucosaminyl-diphospho-decaprenol L-rhamnosyltransferase [Pseudarthrobacter sp. W1I19]|uniref:glycosyltransferase family 2 protein n=1 Tax=Pseudarthrobacter sp. W1I19 TaxID=3042288 RepID=UPI002781479A|nr:glycosyltransferase family 2 protein [Pseudarthrobacter sp. W1I19]MDQ0922272.1 N-acetylglucosaminyl-diphospho-decaprenol L-rhamnosyltransferase [Pseudarthrobacter sp. W1I19]
MKPLEVSAVIPHFGPPAPTLALIESLRSQASVSVQIIVSDDASPEPFPDVDGVCVVRRPVNGGFGSAVNSGMAQADKEYALVLNSDLELGPGFIRDLLAAAKPWQPAVVSPQVVGRDGSTQWVGRHFPTALHQTVEWLSPLARYRHLKLLHEAVGHDTRCVDGAVVPVDWVFGAAMLIPVAAFRQVGGFDEGFFMNSEEVDLQRRLKDIGIPSVFLGTSCVMHEGGGSSDPTRRRQWLVDSRLRYARKWGGERALKLALSSASAANYVVNRTRQFLGRDIDARATLRVELSYLTGGNS